MAYKLKVGPPSGLKLKGSAGIALPVFGRTGIFAEKLRGVWNLDLDYTRFSEIGAFDASQKLFAVYDRTTGAWSLLSVAALLSYGQTQQFITTGDATVQPNDGLIVINKTVGAATIVTLPLVSQKVGPVKIADLKGDAGTNNITINTQGSDKFSGGLTSWVISADTGSVLLHPTTGGYAV